MTSGICPRNARLVSHPKGNSCSSHANKIKDKHCTILSIHTKSFDKNPTPVHGKNSPVGLEQHFLNLTNGIYKKRTAVMLNDENCCFLSKISNKARTSILTIAIQCTKDSSQGNWRRKIYQRHPKKQMKVFPIADDIPCV